MRDCFSLPWIWTADTLQYDLFPSSSKAMRPSSRPLVYEGFSHTKRYWNRSREPLIELFNAPKISIRYHCHMQGIPTLLLIIVTC